MVKPERTARRKTRGSGVASAGLWLSLGLALGVGAAIMLNEYIDKKFDTPKTPIDVSQQNTAQNNQPAKKADPYDTAGRFDFFTLLPELEVVIPEDEPQEKPVPEATKTSEPTSVSPVPPGPNIPEVQATGGYLLQVGSFQRNSEADAMKAKLALLGVEANIESVSVNKDTWHRVRIGPYKDLGKVNEFREHLRKNHIDSLLMKARQ